jgi:U32 family peptidase
MNCIAQTASSLTGSSQPGGTALPCPELLAPAGDWQCARAAVENGADAIYFGLSRFNARMRAHNFTETDLPGLMAFLNRRGVKGYITFNTLVFENELEHAAEYLRTIIAAGVDAAIVQDAGICRLIRQISPDFPIHASTQMTITSAAGVEFAKELGCHLVVLARECSIKEIEAIHSSMRPDENGSAAGVNAPSLPLEVFVHGALCVAYSGQCLTSESLGGRSANRGECAQACRLPYELISDEKPVPLGDKRYLLSPQDLSGVEVLPELVRAGVSSLKIEGRLKTPEYVANITSVYRQALDRIVREMRASQALPEDAQRDRERAETESIWRESRYDLEMGFSRGLHTGWLRGINNQELAHARFGKKRGVFLGTVRRLQGAKVVLELGSPLKPGDGVVFDAGNPEIGEEGGRVHYVETRGTETLLSFGAGEIDFKRIRPGHKVWKTSDPALDRRLRQTFTGDTPQFKRPLHFETHGAPGIPLTMIARDDLGHIAQVESTMPLVPAATQPVTTERLREQIGRLGSSPFALGELRNRIEGAVMLPVGELNRMRRELVAQIEAQRAAPKRWQLVPKEAAGEQRPSISRPTEPDRGPVPGRSNMADESASKLIVLVRNAAQLETVLGTDVETIYCEFEDPKKYRAAVTTVREASANDGKARTVWVAPPRIFKTGEEWILKQVRSSEADGCLARNYDHLKSFADWRLIGDFSLNVANSLAAGHFMNRFGLERLTASYDLNNAQLEALLKGANPEWFEITIHQHMPMFHMEHCVFCAFLSSGTDYRNCGRPCDTHEVRLRDRVGAEHPLKADAGCRNTVFNSRAQTGAEYVSRFQALGVNRFRIEFLNEDPAHVLKTISSYRKLVRGEMSGAELWRELKLIHQLGVTRGQLDKAH